MIDVPRHPESPIRSDFRAARAEPSARLLAVTDWRIAPPFGLPGESLLQQVSRMGGYIRTQAGSALAAAGLPSAPHILCSTMLSRVVADVPERASVLLRAAAVSEESPPLGLLNIYECAGWGYAIRFFEDFMTGDHLLVSIVDADFHDMQENLLEARIGRLGFGLTTFLLSVSRGRSPSSEPAGPFPDGGLREFLRALRNRMTANPSPTFVPFLKPELRELTERLVGGDQLGPNLHDLHGHCFGSDPWIGIIDWLSAAPLTSPQEVLAGTIAINGYYAVCRVGVSPDTWFERRSLASGQSLTSEWVAAGVSAPVSRRAEPAPSGV